MSFSAETEVEKRRLTPSAQSAAETGIVFDQVSFQYPGDLKPVTGYQPDDSTGRHIALVGENGAGKTTLVKLLCRLYDPTSGAITLDGVDIRDYSTKAASTQYQRGFQELRALPANRTGKHLAW
jgi:ABC-type multidrug transport system fused ATPase/permease subunit